MNNKLQRGNAVLIGIVVLVLAVSAGGYFWFKGQNNSMMPSELIEEADMDEHMDEDKVGGEGEGIIEEGKDTMDGSTMHVEEKTFTIITTPYKFSMTEIKVKKGDRVRIVLKNEGGLHDWVVDEFNARTKQLKVGETDTIEFVADKVGTFEYYCSVMQHRQMGMVGKLIVTE